MLLVPASRGSSRERSGRGRSTLKPCDEKMVRIVPRNMMRMAKNLIRMAKNLMRMARSEMRMATIFADRQFGVLTPGPPVRRDSSQRVTVKG